MKEKLYKFFHPNNIMLLFGIITIILSLSYLIFFDKFGTPESYILYLVMSYSFIIICIKIYGFLYKSINKFINHSKYLKIYRDNSKIRYLVSLLGTLCLNTIYALFKFASGIYFKSLWLISFSIYYFILIILRINILKQEFKKDKNIIDEYLCFRKTGIILLFINLFITIIILIIVNSTTLKSYNEIIAITTSCYTFYLMISSIRNLIKYRKHKSPLMISAKVINVVTSLISMLSLEIIMLSTFGPEKTEFNKTTIMATGGGIGIIIIGISSYMIIKGTDFLNSKNEKVKN